MSDLSDDYSHVGDYELRQELIKWDKLRNRRANKSLKMPPTDIGTSKLPANGKDNGYGPPPENAQLKRNIETKMGTTDSEETEPNENKVPSNEKGNGHYRLLSDNAKKNDQLRRDIKKILGIIDSEEKETDCEPKETKFCAMFSWVQLFFGLAFLLLSFAVFYCCASNKTQTCPTNTPIHSNSSSMPSNVREPPFLMVWWPVIDAIIFYIVVGSVIFAYIGVFSLFVFMFCTARHFSAIEKREQAEEMNEYYAKIDAELREQELEMARIYAI